MEKEVIISSMTMQNSKNTMMKSLRLSTASLKTC